MRLNRHRKVGSLCLIGLIVLTDTADKGRRAILRPVSLPIAIGNGVPKSPFNQLFMNTRSPMQTSLSTPVLGENGDVPGGAISRGRLEFGWQGDLSRPVSQPTRLFLPSIRLLLSPIQTPICRRIQSAMPAGGSCRQPVGRAAFDRRTSAGARRTLRASATYLHGIGTSSSGRSAAAGMPPQTAKPEQDGQPQQQMAMPQQQMAMPQSGPFPSANGMMPQASVSAGGWQAPVRADGDRPAGMQLAPQGRCRSTTSMSQ